MSGRQNQYILVFTIATVFYLPMSFVTVWKAFQKPVEWQR
jgi:Mg2+ and Co2+ transporter CorA